MPEETIDKHEQLVEELEDLISQLSQQADIRANATQIFAEDVEKRAEQREKKRWGWFLAIVTSVLLGLAVLGFETWERHYDRLTAVEKSLIKVESRQEIIQQQMVRGHELQAKIAEIGKTRAEEREKALNELEHELRKEIEKLHPRKK